MLYSSPYLFERLRNPFDLNLSYKMDNVLHESILGGDVEQALHQTCKCLHDEKCILLEETWLRIISRIGECIRHSSHATLFYSLMTEMYICMHKESLAIREALQLTSKLVLACQRPFVKTPINHKKTIQKLRSNIIEYFPNDARLTNSGRNKFGKILPMDPEEREFLERIIVGLMRLNEQNVPEDMREAIEYLSRKRIALDGLATSNLHRVATSLGVDKEDLVPYLWIILKMVKPLSYQKKLEELYYYQYKTSYKPYRIGYLVAYAYLEESCATSTVPIWSQVEYTLLQRVYESSLDMWKEYKEALKPSGTGPGGIRSHEEKLPLLQQFTPRCTVPVPTTIQIQARNNGNDNDMEAEMETKKTVHIRKKRLKKTPPLTAKKSNEEESNEPIQNASNSYHTGGRRFDFSQAWPGIQNRVPPKNY